MSQLLDSDFQQQPDLNKDLETLRNRIFIMAAVCGLLWLNVRYFLLEKVLAWSKPLVGPNDDTAMVHIFVNISYLIMLLLGSFLLITFSIESTKKYFMDNGIALVISTLISAVGFWVGLLIVGVLVAGLFDIIGFSERISPDMGFLVIAVGGFWWLYVSFRKKLEV